MTGEHVYADASDNCNSLDFQLGDNAVDIAAIATRSVSIKVSSFGVTSLISDYNLVLESL
jgi:hypothetical protein